MVKSHLHRVFRGTSVPVILQVLKWLVNFSENKPRGFNRRSSLFKTWMSHLSSVRFGWGLDIPIRKTLPAKFLVSNSRTSWKSIDEKWVCFKNEFQIRIIWNVCKELYNLHWITITCDATFYTLIHTVFSSHLHIFSYVLSSTPIFTLKNQLTNPVHHSSSLTFFAWLSPFFILL
jgi:hypothetical protein